MYVSKGGGEKDRGSLGQGRGWKVALIPTEHRGRGDSPVRGRGCFFLAVALVLIETSNMTKTGLTGRVNGAAVTEQLYSASHTPRSPLSSRPALPYFSFMPPLLLYELISSARHQCHGSIWCVRAWCVCPRTCQGAVWDLHIRGRKRYKWSRFKKRKKKRWAQMSFTSRGGAGGE